MNLPGWLRTHLDEADEAYAAWESAEDDFFAEEALEASASRLSAAVSEFVAGAVLGGAPGDEVVRIVCDRYPAVSRSDFFRDALTEALESPELFQTDDDLTGSDEGYIQATGVNGQVSFDGEIIRISRRGAMAFMTQGIKGDKEIHVAQLSAVQFKKAGPAFNGYIQFSFLGGHETKGGILDATRDENSVMFTMRQADRFESLRAAVQQRMNEILSGRGTAQASSPAPDPLAQIEKLGELRDKGLITEEEFQSKKSRLLDLI
jgi:hypothetical protein